MIAKLKGSTSTLALAAAVSFAAPAELEAQSVNWEGFYVGLHLGAGEAFMDGAYQTGDTTGEEVLYDRLDLKGIAGGLHGGYNWDFEDFVLGFEADITGVDWRDDAGNLSTSDEQGDAVIEFLASVRARLGLPLGPDRQFLPYVSGGIAFVNGQARASSDGPLSGPFDDRQTVKFNDVGAVIGGGVEWAPDDEFRLRFEGLYYYFGDRQSLTLDEALPADFVELEDAYVLRAGLSWYFNAPEGGEDIQPAGIRTEPVDWGGAYIGVHLGGGEAFLDGRTNRTNTDDSVITFDDLGMRGIVGGGQFGFNWDQGMFVLGMEGDVSGVDWSNEEDSLSSSEFAEGDIDLLASLRARVGVPLGDEREVLAYATAGLAFVDGEVLTFDPSAGIRDKSTFNDVGGVFGGGLEWAATDAARVRVEGLYYLFDDRESVSILSGSANDFVELEGAYVVRVGLNWFFDTPTL